MRGDNDAISIFFFSMTRLEFPFSHCCVYVSSYLCLLVRLKCLSAAAGGRPAAGSRCHLTRAAKHPDDGTFFH